MLQLGMDTEGTELRAKMQSTSLLSDMESFKAANPGSSLNDFLAKIYSKRTKYQMYLQEFSPPKKCIQNKWGPNLIGCP